MTVWLALAYCLIGALYSFVVRRTANQLGRRSLVWSVLAFGAGPLVLPLLLVMRPKGSGQTVIPRRLLALVTVALIVVGASGTGALFLVLLNPTPDQVIATTHIDGVNAPTDADGPTAFAISMLITFAALSTGAAIGSIVALLLAPPVAFIIHVARQPKATSPQTTERDVSSKTRRTSIRLAHLMGVPLGGAFLLLSAWTYAFGMPRSAGISLLSALPFLSWHLNSRVAILARRALLIGLLGIVLLSWKTPGRELQSSLQRLQNLKDTAGPTAFSRTEKLSLFSLNIAMAAGGFAVGFPEIAKETLYLCLGGPSIRAWESDFAMRSPKVRAAIQGLVDFAERHEKQERPLLLPETQISWNQYSTKADSLRVALALNSPMKLRGTAHREGAHWHLQLVASARVEYPRRAVHSIFAVDGKAVQLDEGLFWVLQQSGWLHPYTAEWRWSILSDDPRLQDLRTPILSPRERLVNWIVSKP